MTKKTLTTFDVSRICNVNPTTVSRWIDEGTLEGFRTPGGHRRITQEAFFRFVRKNNLPFGLEGVQEKKRILLVDNQSDSLQNIETILKNENCYEIERAQNGVEAILKLDRFLPDLLLLDLVMPDLDALAMIRNLKSNRRFRSIPIIALGPASAKKQGERAKRSGLSDFLAKPVKGDELVKKVREHLAR